MTFKAWFSETPGGAVLDTAGGCSKTVVEPNPLRDGNKIMATAVCSRAA